MDQPRQVSSQPQQASAWDEPDPEGCCRSSDGKYFVKGGVVISLAEHVLPQIYENVPDDTILAGQRNGDEYPLYNSNNTYIGGITIEQLDPIFSVVCAEKNVEFAEAVTITAPTIIGRKGNVKPSIKLINKLRDDATNEGVLLEQLAREDGKNKNSKKLKGLLTSAKRENLKSGVVNLMIKEAKDRDVDNDPHGQTQIAQGGVPWGGGAPDPIVPDPAVSIVIMSHGGHQFTSESINNPANNTHYITKWTSVEDAVNTGVCSVSYRTTSRTGTISSKKAFLSPAKDGAELLTELSRSSPKSQFKMQDIGSAIERRAVQTSLPLKITDHNGLQMTERVKDPRYNDKPITKWTSVKNAVESGICELTYYSSIESLNRKAFLFPAKKAAEQLATLYAQKGDFYFEDIGRAIEIERTKVQPAGDAVPGLEGLDAMVEHNKSALGAATTSGWEPSESWQSEFVGSYKRSLGDDVWQPGAKRGPGSGGGFSEHLHDSGSEFSGTFSADRSTASRGFGGGDDSISFIDATQNLFTHVRAYQRANARYHDPNERAEQQQYADARETALTAAIAVMTDTPRTVAKTRNDLEKEGNSNGVVTLEYFGTEMARRKQGTLNPPPAPPPQRGVGESVGRHDKSSGYTAPRGATPAGEYPSMLPPPVPQSRERIHRNSVWETEVFSQENCGEAGEEEIPIDPQLLGEGGGYPDPTIYQQQPSYPLSQGMQPVDSGFGMDGGSTTPYTPPQPYGGSNARSVWQPVTYTTSAITHTAEEQYPSGQYPSGTGSSSAAAGQFGGSGAESQGAPTHVAQQPSVYYYPETKTVGTLGSSGYPHSQSGGTSGPYYRQPFDEQQGSQPAASTSPFQGFSNAPTYREAPQGGFTPLQPMPPPPAPSSTTQQRASGRARPPQEGDAEERRPQHQQQRRYRR